MQKTKPKLLIGSPACTFFSVLMRWNWDRMDPVDAKAKWQEALLHMELAIELYNLQMDEGRLFLHEHPRDACSWELPSMKKLMKRPGVVSVVGDQCMFGLVTDQPQLARALVF